MDERGGMEWIREILKELGNLGFEVDMSEKSASGILELGEDLRQRREDPEIVGKIYDMDDIDPSVGLELAEFAMMMKRGDREFSMFLETLRTLRERLPSNQTGKA